MHVTIARDSYVSNAFWQHRRFDSSRGQLLSLLQSFNSRVVRLGVIHDDSLFQEHSELVI